MKILITGAKGFIGSSLTNLLRSKGIETTGVDLEEGEGVFKCNLNDPASWEHLLTGCTVVIHTAALVSNAFSDKQMWEANVLTTHRVINAAIKHGVKRFVHISSIVVYGNSCTGEITEEHPVASFGSNYILTKVAAEQVVFSAASGNKIEVVVVRPGDVYGPACGTWIKTPLTLIKKHQFMLPMNGNGFFRPVYIDDLTDGIYLAATADNAAGEAFNFTCERYVTTKEFFTYHHRWLKKKSPVLISKQLALFLANALSLLGIKTEASVASVNQLCTLSWFSIRKAERLLGWKPKVTLQEGMPLTENWLLLNKII